MRGQFEAIAGVFQLHGAAYIRRHTQLCHDAPWNDVKRISGCLDMEFSVQFYKPVFAWYALWLYFEVLQRGMYVYALYLVGILWAYQGTPVVVQVGLPSYLILQSLVNLPSVRLFERVCRYAQITQITAIQKGMQVYSKGRKWHPNIPTQQIPESCFYCTGLVAKTRYYGNRVKIRNILSFAASSPK